MDVDLIRTAAYVAAGFVSTYNVAAAVIAGLISRSWRQLAIIAPAMCMAAKTISAISTLDYRQQIDPTATWASGFSFALPHFMIANFIIAALLFQTVRLVLRYCKA